ncbi:rhodanese-like domain-containing protein [Tautonia rosea]|uniref:rhodanese-like domain-containing protein n=1 Tax=Tautonia rosea TaxID=2728037 RepID=UPI001475CB0B|nr:rhodanese-like domain-containing protein [Tautonia rosea]
MIQATDVHRWPPNVLKDHLDSGSPLVLLDVREDLERQYCTIEVPETVLDLHVPIGEISRRFDLVRRCLDGRPLVIYCHHGVRSLATAQWLASQGVSDVINLEGGIDAWSLTIDPTVPRY